MTTFGASTVQGIGGVSFQHYLQQNIALCYTGRTVTMTNNGIGGETTTQGRERFDQAIQGRTGFVLILMGTNDAQAIVNKKMTLSETEANMRYFIEESLKYKLVPIIGTLQFFNDKGNQFFKNANFYVIAINRLYRQLAKEYKVYIADINTAIGRNSSLYQDNIHPNDEGYKLISYVWFDAINKAIEDKLLLIGLNQNYPNPVHGDTQIGFSLSQAGRVQIKLYNMNGAAVKSIIDEYESSGYHIISTNLTGLNAGMYIYVMEVGGRQLSKKLLIMK
ncbi:T9SS type A sorting domain-containing protein [Mucilaginibacter robiniae]|uniref:T9SS type A sorting domain-containing protein n=1 Tax=Mucilaginibacter robiniae TaxID=2728022 RepID=A0A7L5E337_9SPHI|nr:GDSL-type esterase/lipase family protein [Mucilaginibacter robiniae]QJD96769.1 T9SS type A sorting domain-containing protein [Mucilaginibacter robiniae]